MIRNHMLLFLFVTINMLACYGSHEGLDAMDIDGESQSETVAEEDSGCQLREAAAAGDRDKVLRLLRAGVSVNSASDDGMTALHWAAMKNRLRIMHDLISFGADVDATTRGGMSPLFMAVDRRKVSAVRYLLAKNADTGFVDNAGITPLLHAIKSSHLEIVSLLLAHGTDEIDEQDDCGNSPLSGAILGNKLPLVLRLVMLGADVNVRSQRTGSFPMHDAAYIGNADVVRCLLEHGARANIMDKNGLIPADVACREGHAELADYLAFVARIQGPKRSGEPRTALSFVGE